MLGLSELFGGSEQALEKLKKSISFSIHCSIPAIVQSYNPQAQTIECQPAIRERIIQEDGQITYMQYPLLINVPVLFPQTGSYSITFPIQKGDECLVIFSDLAIDGWWLHGNVQNPVEIRRHDLSDGIAIFGLRNQDSLSKYNPDGSDGVTIESKKNGTKITVTDDDVLFTYSDGTEINSTSVSEIIQRIEALERKT